MIKFKIDVKSGIIHVNSVTVVKATDDAIYLFADCKSKYPSLGWIAENNDDNFGIALCADQETLRTVPGKSKDQWTEIWIRGLKGRWVMMADIGSYSVGISLINLTHKKPCPELDWFSSEYVA